MRSLAASLACLALGTACYTPKGAFVPVAEYVQPSLTDYVITPGDVLQLRVFQHEPLSTRAKVRYDGRVSLPLVNEWVAGGKTPAALAAELQQKFKDFINSPVVTVSLEEARPLTVSVLGEVGRTGIVVLEPGSGLMQAIAGAGGLNDFAHREGLFVLRVKPGQAKPTRIRFSYDELSRGEGPAASFSLMPGDVVVVE